MTINQVLNEKYTIKSIHKCSLENKILHTRYNKLTKNK